MAVEDLFRESKGALKSDNVGIWGGRGEEGRRGNERNRKRRRGKWKGEEKRKIGKRERRRKEGKGKTGTYCKKGMFISTPLPLCKTGYCLPIKVTRLTCL